jgi:L-iditol 2-dehydrogenase
VTHERNRAAVLYPPRNIRVEERPVPPLDTHDVLVEVRAVGVCGSDVHYYEHGRIGQYEVRSTIVLGHEASGVVVGLGAEARRHSIGDRVALEPGIPCGRCRECRAGRYNLCPFVRFLATPPDDGAFARLVAIHEDFAHPLPESLSDEAGALLEPLSVGVWACWKGKVSAGADVLVTGAGPIGQLAAQVAFALGARSVVVSDPEPERLAYARGRGARTVDVREGLPGSQGVEADVLLECSGNEGALADGIESLRPAGRAVCVGMSPDERVTLPLALVQARELVLTGTFRYANTYPAAIALAEGGRVDLDGLVSARFGLEETERALRAAREDPATIKAMVLPGVDRVDRAA